MSIGLLFTIERTSTITIFCILIFISDTLRNEKECRILTSIYLTDSRKNLGALGESQPKEWHHDIDRF